MRRGQTPTWRPGPKARRRRTAEVPCRRALMKRAVSTGIAIAATFILFSALPTTSAVAQRGFNELGTPKGGYCPPGTCGKYGGKSAKKVKNCKAEHCRR